MQWDVKFLMRDGSTLRVNVIATNQYDAEYRAAAKAEKTGVVLEVIFCRRMKEAA